MGTDKRNRQKENRRARQSELEKQIQRQKLVRRSTRIALLVGVVVAIVAVIRRLRLKQPKLRLLKQLSRLHRQDLLNLVKASVHQLMAQEIKFENLPPRQNFASTQRSHIQH